MSWPVPVSPVTPVMPRRSPPGRKRLIAVIVSMLVGCLGCVGYISVNTARGDLPVGLTAPGDGGASAAPVTPTRAVPRSAVPGVVPPGSTASSFPVRTDKDLERVCDKWFYPKSPRYTAAAPHPIMISVNDRTDLDYRTTASVALPYEATDAVEAAWKPEKPADVQVVACVDLISTKGPKVGSCTVKDPKPETIIMKAGVYQLSLYEVATRRRLLQARMTGEDEDCPWLVMVGDDPAIYSGPHDRQLVETLRSFVEQ
jgi:hypothetical protein